MIGLSAAEALSELLRNRPSISQVQLVAYEFAPLLQDRAPLTMAERSLVRRGLQVRHQLGLPFWDSLLAICSAEMQAPTGLLKAALFHQTREGTKTVLSRAEVRRGDVHRMLKSQPARGGLALSSGVSMNSGRRAHLPLLDLHYRLKSGPGNAIAIAQLLLASGFVVLETGKSYHIWGTRPVTQNELVTFLGRALLLAPMVDRAFVAHQLLEGDCALRISAGSVNREVPRVVAVG